MEYFDLFSYITRIFAIIKFALEALFQLSVLPFAIMATTVDKVRTVFLELRISYANNPPQIKDIEAEVCCSP